jgi:hypothetical protein
MAKKLNINVHAVERDSNGDLTGRSEVFKAGDTVPAWARQAITNPDVWDDGEDDTEDAEDDTPERPAGNASRETWATYAASRGVTVTEDMKRDDIVSAVDKG